MNEERDRRVAEFNGWMQADNDIAQMGRGVFRAREMRSAQHLAAEHPDVFDELYETAADLLEQAPTEEVPSWR